MSAYWHCLLSKIVSIAGFVTLVIFDHPWIGLICLIFVATIDGEIKAEK